MQEVRLQQLKVLETPATQYRELPIEIVFDAVPQTAC